MHVHEHTHGVVGMPLVNKPRNTITSTYAASIIPLQYVTVHAKISLVRTKIENHFFAPVYSYIH